MSYSAIADRLPGFLRRHILHFEASIEDALAEFAQGVRAGDRVLDAGAGEGRHSKYFPAARYCGVDLAVGDAGWNYGGLDAIADLEALPFRDGAFAACINIVTLEHVCRPHRVLRELALALRPGGRMLLHTIVQTDWNVLRRSGIPVTHEDVLFAKFIRERIFPAGQLCTPRIIIDHAERAGFTVTQTQSLRPHYARTLDIWAANLRAAKDRAIELTSQETYEMYMKYLTGCADYFRSGHNDVIQFTCECAD